MTKEEEKFSTTRRKTNERENSEDKVHIIYIKSKRKMQFMQIREEGKKRN